MPKRLLDRCQPDSIREFRPAARRRFDDALVLATHGQRTGAIYLWGYTAEMILKAAYSSFIGMAEADPITWQGHLQPAISGAAGLGIIWPPSGKGHNVEKWAELLVNSRAGHPTAAYPAAFGLDVQSKGQQIWQIWRETLRYHKNVAYLHEVRQMRGCVEWLLIHSDLL
jgi:hypothetical protein